MKIILDLDKEQDPVFLPYGDSEFIKWEFRSIETISYIDHRDIIAIPASFCRDAYDPRIEGFNLHSYVSYTPFDFNELDREYIQVGSWIYSAAGRQYYKKGGYRSRVAEVSLTPPWWVFEERDLMYSYIKSNFSKTPRL